ncbi:hypothetical protein ACRQV7_03045 [Caproiciproducens sp. R2]|uniref:hypothetical protein n=1 Tax=Caproiciproducens sp. R2 TaxID=3435187 RepID=UPI0040342A16
MEKVNKNVVIICLSFIIALLVATAALKDIEYNKHYYPMQHYEVSCLTNAVYKLSDKNTDEQRQKIISDIMRQRGKNKNESNVVDVLESNPDIYGQWGEDDIKKPKSTDQEKYEKAQAAVEKFITENKISVIGIPPIE